MDCAGCKTVLDAATNGHIYCLKELHTNGFPLDYTATRMAAGMGHLDCLKYLLENRCPLDFYAIFIAAMNGHYNCLLYLCKFPANETLSIWNMCIAIASRTGSLKCLSCLLENDHLNHLAYLSSIRLGCSFIWNTDNVPVLLYLYDKKINDIPDDKLEIVRNHISEWNARVNVAKIIRRYIPSDIWNIVRSMYFC